MSDADNGLKDLHPKLTLRHLVRWLLIAETAALAAVVTYTVLAWLPFENIDPGEGAVPAAGREPSSRLWAFAGLSAALVPWFVIAVTGGTGWLVQTKRAARALVVVTHVGFIGLALGALVA